MKTPPSFLLVVLAATSAPTRASTLTEYDLIDSNDDGRVSSSEHEVYARKLFDQIDVDGDYKLTIAEIAASRSKFFRHVSAGAGGIFGASTLSAAEQIQRIDANGDGVISRDEHANAAAAKFQAMDIDHNGELSEGEFYAGG